MSDSAEQLPPSITTTHDELERFVATRVAAHDKQRNAEFATYLQTLQREEETRRINETNEQRAVTQQLNNQILQLQCVLYSSCTAVLR